MRETDVDIVSSSTDHRISVIVRLSARSRAHAVGAYVYAEDTSPDGYKLASVDIRPYRPKGGRQRRVTLHYEWTGKPSHHEPIEGWEKWAELLEEVEQIAKGTSKL